MSDRAKEITINLDRAALEEIVQASERRVMRVMFELFIHTWGMFVHPRWPIVKDLCERAGMSAEQIEHVVDTYRRYYWGR